MAFQGNAFQHNAFQTALPGSASEPSRNAGGPFATRRIGSRKHVTPVWIASLAPVAAVVPASAWLTRPTIRRTDTRRKLVVQPVIRWQAMASILAAALKVNRPNVVEFKRKVILPAPLILATPPTGPPVDSWKAVALKRVSPRKRLLVSTSQPVYPATPAEASPEASPGLPFVTRKLSGRKFIRPLDVPVYPPVVQPVGAPKVLKRRKSNRRLVVATPAPVYPAVVTHPALQPARALKRRDIERKPRFSPAPPVFPAPAAQAVYVKPPAVFRRKSGGRAIWVDVIRGGDETPQITQPVYPSFVPVGYNRRRDTERRLQRARIPPVYPVSESSASEDSGAGGPYVTRRVSSRRFIRQANAPVYPAADAGVPWVASQGSRPIARRDTERRLVSPTAAPAYPEPVVTTFLSAPAVIRRRAGKRKVYAAVLPIWPEPPPPPVYPSFVQTGYHYRRDTERRLLVVIIPPLADALQYTIDDLPQVNMRGFESITLHGSGAQLFIVSDYKPEGS